jgi:uncharacterized membrane protein
VSARHLLAVFDSVYVLALSAWLGSILFFSFCVAPLVFRVLGSEAAGRFLRALFPRYYRWGAISGSIALPAYVAGPLCVPEYRGPMVGASAMAIVASTLVMFYAANSLVPQINQARDAGPTGHDRFQQLHRRSVRLNSIVLCILLALLVAFVNRPAPRTEGIVEMTPAQRAEYDAAVDRAIEDAEARRGIRPARVPEPIQAGKPGMVLDRGTLKEIDSYYPPKPEGGTKEAAPGSAAKRPGRP